MQVISKIQRRARWYKSRFQVNNPIVGRAVELLGNKVRMDGLVYSVDTPQLSRGHKSTLAFGLHEMEERELILRWMPANIPVIEFGGGLGVVSCLSNRKLADPTKHIVVEANPRMIPILERNRELNGCKFRVVNKAIAYDCAEINLNVDAEFVGSTIKGESASTVPVPTTSIADVMSGAGFDQVGIICDIEGAELDVIKREFPVLGGRIRFIMAEMHPVVLGEKVVSDLIDILVTLGFEKRQQLGDCVFYSR